MGSKIDEKLREKSEKFRERHDDAVIADVIGEVEALESESSEQTAEILRTLSGFEE